MKNSMIYNSGEMIDCLNQNKFLMFECVMGIYDGECVKYDTYLQRIVFDGRDYEVTLTKEFLKCKWKPINLIMAKVIEVIPYFEYAQVA